MAGIRVRKLTDDELRAWRADIAARMTALEQKWDKSGHTDLHALVGGLTFCQTQVPPWVFAGVLKSLKRLHKQLPQQPSRDWGRYQLVLEGRQRRDARGRPLSWRKAYEYASEQARAIGKPFAGGWRTMKESYQIIKANQRGIPRRKRRKKLGQ